jgi:hypothetical protein
LYAAVNWRRLATARTSKSGAALGPTAGTFALVVDIDFSCFLVDIDTLPFDSNSTKVGVSRHIDTNGWMTGSNWSTGQPPDGVVVIIDRGEANPVLSLVSDASVYLRSIHASESLTISLSGWRAELLLVEPSSFLWCHRVAMLYALHPQHGRHQRTAHGVIPPARRRRYDYSNRRSGSQRWTTAHR